MVAEISPGRVTARRTGRFGVLTAEMATPLSMVLTELLQNALEHGFGQDESGAVEVTVLRGRELLAVAVQDNGRGLPAGFDAQQAGNLGLQIVRTLVESELRGSLSLRRRDRGGTEAQLRVPLSHRR